MTTDQPKKDSRLAKHLQILDLEQSEFSDGELKAERDGIASMRPPALNLDSGAFTQPPKASKMRPSVWYTSAAVAMAAMIAIVVYSPKEEGGFQVKGQGSVRIYAENAGKVIEWDKKTALANGSRVRVEFKATEDIVAYLGVIGRDQIDLLPVGMIWERRLRLANGEVGQSEGSIELAGADEGETILAVTCPKGQAVSESVEFGQFWLEAKAASKNKVSSLKGCALETVSLR